MKRLALIALCVLAGGCGSEGTTTVTVTETVGETTEEPAPTAEAPTEAQPNGETSAAGGLGEKVTFPDEWAVTITDVERRKTISGDFGKETAQGTFVILTLDVVNLRKRVETFDDSFITLIESDGTEYVASAGGGENQIGVLENYLDEREIQPKTPETGKLAFDVPQSAAMKLQYARVQGTFELFAEDDGESALIELN